jgi:hypothetical protein
MQVRDEFRRSLDLSQHLSRPGHYRIYDHPDPDRDDPVYEPWGYLPGDVGNPIHARV